MSKSVETATIDMFQADGSDLTPKQKKKAKAKPVTPEQFEAFWRAYPRREGKGKARDAFAGAMQVASFEEIMGGLRRQLPVLSARDHQFIALPATWLNQERWEDELQPIKARPAQRQSGGMAGFMAARQETQNAWTLDGEFTRTADRDASAFALEHAPYGRGH